MTRAPPQTETALSTLHEMQVARAARAAWCALSPGWRSAWTKPTQKAIVPDKRTSASPTCAGAIPAAAMPAPSLTCGQRHVAESEKPHLVEHTTLRRRALRE